MRLDPSGSRQIFSIFFFFLYRLTIIIIMNMKSYLKVIIIAVVFLIALRFALLVNIAASLLFAAFVTKRIFT